MTQTPFFDKTYDETMALLIAARDYMAYAAPLNRPGQEPVQRLRASCEALRLTARLSHVMAWLLAQKAVHAGEITQAKAAEAFRLSDEDTDLLEAEDGVSTLPEGLQELLRKSRSLYIRVSRLDALVRRAAAQD